MPFPFPGDLPNPGIEPRSPTLAGVFFTTELTGTLLLSLPTKQRRLASFALNCSILDFAYTQVVHRGQWNDMLGFRPGILIHHCLSFVTLDFPGDSVVKNSPANAGDTGNTGSIPGLERSPEEEIAVHSSILAWRTLCTEEPGGLQSVWSQRVGYNLAIEHRHGQ